jgi:hypothetical protein
MAAEFYGITSVFASISRRRVALGHIDQVDVGLTQVRDHLDIIPWRWGKPQCVAQNDDVLAVCHHGRASILPSEFV